MFVYKLIARHTVEEKVQQMQQYKRGLADQLFAGTQGQPWQGSAMDLLALFGEGGVKATFFTLGWVAERYPAHLHMNLLPRLQRRGVGALLLGTWLAAARARGAHSLRVPP